ncbi:MAG TPA: hypothetical protein VNN18_08385 [Candidatus Xenobia bacterium]|nr:hypothetical protein [Candidatus Xenobia bacterium]
MRKHILLGVTAAALIAAATPAAAQPQANEAVRKLYTDFFEAFTQAGPAGAIGVLGQSGSIPQRTTYELERRMQSFQPTVGRADSWTLVAELEIPNSLRYRSALFLTYHENVPVAWRLRFYQRTNGVWVIVDVDYELRYVEDFLRLPEIEFTAHRALIERLSRDEERDRGRGSRWP